MIIYSKEFTPIIDSPESIRFVPIEGVVAVVEVKSVCDSTTLNDALSHLSAVKRERAKAKASIARRTSIRKCLELEDGSKVSCELEKGYQPDEIPYDQLVTCLFAAKFDVTPKTVKAKLLDQNLFEHATHRPNLLCAVQNYCTSYTRDDNKSWFYPALKPSNGDLVEFPPYAEYPKPGTYGHLKIFFRYLLMAIEKTTIMHPELTDMLDLSSDAVPKELC